MADSNILSDFGINILEEEIDDVIFQTNEFLTDATFTGSQGPFWWIAQYCPFLRLQIAIIQCFVISRSVRQISNGTKTGQNHRKIKLRTLLSVKPTWVASTYQVQRYEFVPILAQDFSYFSHSQSHFRNLAQRGITQMTFIHLFDFC